MITVKEAIRSHISGGYSVGLNEVESRLARGTEEVVADCRRNDWRGRLADLDDATIAAEVESYREDVAAGVWA